MSEDPGMQNHPRYIAMRAAMGAVTGGAAAEAEAKKHCGWCDSTHIADISCGCVVPCDRDWCPRKTELQDREEYEDVFRL